MELSKVFRDFLNNLWWEIPPIPGQGSVIWMPPQHGESKLVSGVWPGKEPDIDPTNSNDEQLFDPEVRQFVLDMSVLVVNDLADYGQILHLKNVLKRYENRICLKQYGQTSDEHIASLFAKQAEENKDDEG